MGLYNQLPVFSYCLRGVYRILTFVKVVGTHRVSDEGREAEDFSATVEQVRSQFLVKFSVSGDHVVQDYLLKPRLEEGVYSCICYHNRPGGNPCNTE